MSQMQADFRTSDMGLWQSDQPSGCIPRIQATKANTFTPIHVAFHPSDRHSSRVAVDCTFDQPGPQSRMYAGQKEFEATPQLRKEDAWEQISRQCSRESGR